MLLICFFTSSITCLAQEDTVRLGRLSDIDTLIDPPPMIVPDEIIDEESDDVGSGDEVDEESKTLFAAKSSSGGPDSFRLRVLNDSVVNAMKNDNSFWYADKVFHKKASPEISFVPFWQRPGFQSLMWVVIIIAFVGILILYLKEGNISIFRSTKHISETAEEEGTENIFVINYQKEIDKAITAADYRLAIRLMYLRLLRNLSEKGAIAYTQDKTNFDYLAEASSKKWYNLFFIITRNYEYAWYGHFEVDSNKFEVIRKEFMDFEKQYSF